jgi:hypothetical protein
MTDDQILAAFLHGMPKLHIDDYGLTNETNPLDATTMVWLANELYCRIKSEGQVPNTPHDWCVQRLAMLTAAVILGPTLGASKARRKRVVRKWLIARSELLQMRIPCR